MIPEGEGYRMMTPRELRSFAEENGLSIVVWPNEGGDLIIVMNNSGWGL